MEQTLTIDGRELTFAAGQTILEVTSADGIVIPTLCYLPEAGHRDVCRICVVEVEGAGRLLPACSTPATAGMVVATMSERVTASRRQTLELLIGSGDHSCITCEALGSCELSRLAYEYGVETPARAATEEFPLIEDGYVVRDYSKCILCGRCWAACTAIQVHGVVPHPSGRRAERGGGKDWYPLPDLEQCVLCGQCVEVCPVGALTERRVKGVARAWELERVRTTCPHCGMGCQTVVHLKDGEIIKVTGAGDAPPNRGRLCSRGRFSAYEQDERERLTSPLLRRDGELRPVSWSEALGAVAGGLAEVVDRDGPDAVAGLFSPSQTTEDAYQAQKFFRAVIGTNNIDHRPGVASAFPLDELGEAPTCYVGGALEVLERARVILVVGDGDIDDSPVAGAALRKAVRDGARLLLLDSGHNALGDLATRRISVEAHAVESVLNGIMSVLPAERGEHHEPVPHHGDAEIIRGIAADLTGIRPAVVVATLGAGDPAGTWAAVTRLQALLDDVAGALHVSLPRGRGNAQGLLDMGVVPGLLPGRLAVTDETARRHFAQAWGVGDLPATPGLATAELLTGLSTGAVKAVWVSADDADAFGEQAELLDRLSEAELVIVQGTVSGELARVADVVLPAASWGEEDGTFVNSERRVSRVRRVRRPPVEARPRWWVFRELASRFEHQWQASSPEAIWDTEIARLAPGLDGVKYVEIDEWGLCWHATPRVEEPLLV